MYIDHQTDYLQNQYLKSLPTDKVMEKVKNAIEAEATIKSTRPEYNGISWEKLQQTIMFNKTA